MDKPKEILDLEKELNIKADEKGVGGILLIPENCFFYHLRDKQIIRITISGWNSLEGKILNSLTCRV